MTLTNNEIPLTLLLILVVLGAIIFIGFSLYRRLILPAIIFNESDQTLVKKINRFEIIMWGVYFITAIYCLLEVNLVVTSVLLAFIVLLFYDFLRNYFAGIIIRFGDKIQMGDTVTINQNSGKIVEFNNSSLKIINSLGEEILIPYKMVSTELKIGSKSKPKVLFKTLSLPISSKENINYKNNLERLVYANPWIIITKPVTISLDEEKVIISFYVLNNDFFNKAKIQLQQDLGRL